MTPRDTDSLASKPGAWAELALTLPIFVAYHLGVVFLHVRNATDLVTARLMQLAAGDKMTYLGITAAIGILFAGVFAVLGRGQALRARKIVQIAIEGAAYAIAMGAATSWIVGKIFARPLVTFLFGAPAPGGSARAIEGPLTGLVMSLGAGFYEELAFRALLFGLGAKLLVWMLARERVSLVAGGAAPGLRAIGIMVVWAIACAAAFSGMHYVGALGDAFDLRSFVARAVLGLALTLVYAMRGFAAAVWAHALYDVWVLVG